MGWVCSWRPLRREAPRDWMGREVYEPIYETIIEYITFKEYGIAMAAEGWKGEPVMGENDYYGRQIADVNRIYEGNAYE